MKRLYCYFIFALLLFYGCTREEILDFPKSNVKPQLVAIGFLTPGDSIHIYLGSTVPFGLAKELPETYVRNAKVHISEDNGNSIPLTLSSSTLPIYSCSQQDLPIKKGKSYHLHAVAANFQEVKAKTTVPNEKAVWNSAGFTYNSSSGIEFQGSWHPLQDEQEIDYSVYLYRTKEPSDILFGNEGIIKNKDEYTIKRDIYFNNDAQAVLMTRTKAMGAFSKMAELNNEVRWSYADAAFYDVISAFKGILPSYSNIENGVGVFGSYLLDVKTFKP